MNGCVALLIGQSGPKASRPTQGLAKPGSRSCEHTTPNAEIKLQEGTNVAVLCPRLHAWCVAAQS